MGQSCSNGVRPCLCLVLLTMIAVCHSQQQQQTQQRPTITVGGRQYYRDEYINYYYSSYFYRRFYNYFANWYSKIRERILGHLASVCPQQSATTTLQPTTLQTTTITVVDTTQQSTANQTTTSCTCPTTVPTTTDSTNSTVTPAINITSTAGTMDTPDTVTANATANAIAPLFRIPLAFYPDNYTLILYPVALGFNGNVRILMTCREATRKLYLHSSEIIIYEDIVEFTFENGSSAGNILNITYDTEMQYVIFDLSDESIVGLQYYITISYKGIVQTHKLRGLFAENDEPRNIEGAGFSKPYYARSIFPCFDEPAIKAPFTVTLARNAASNYFTLSTTEISNTVPRSGNNVVEIYTVTPELSTYTLGLLVGKDVVSVDSQVKGGLATLKWRNVHENKTVHQRGYNAVRSYLNSFEDIWGRGFPYNLDVFVSRQLYEDGMENAGLIFFREADFFIDESVSPVSRKQDVVRLVARKMAQQAIGVRVSVAWWDDLGMFEGIAEYLTYKSMTSTDNFSMDEQFVPDIVIPAFNRDSFYVSPPVYTPLEDARDLRKNFSPLSYQKTAALLRMMEFIIGQSEFNNRLREFYAQYQRKAASHRDFMQSLTDGITVTVDGSDRNFADIMEPYIYQHSFPVINAIAADPFDRIKVFPRVPKLYGNSEEGFPTPYDYQWTVPITYAHSGNLTVDNTDITWFNFSQHTAAWAHHTIQDPSFGDLSSTWFIVNVKLLGYYRVKYGVGNYDNLKTKLASASYTDIDPANRAQIVSDFFYFAQEDNCIQLPMFSSLLFESMANERHYVPLKAIFEVIDSLDKMLKLHELYPKFLAKVKPFVTGMFTDIMNVTDPSSLTHIELLARELIIKQACRFGVEGCAADSKRLFSEWMVNTTNNPIDPSQKEAVYCTAIREGSYTEWDFLYTRLSVNEDFTGPEAITMIRALACTGNPNLIRRFVENIIRNTKVSGVWQTMQEALVSLTENPIGKCDVVGILNEHFIEDFKGSAFLGLMDDSGGMVRIFESIGKVSTAISDIKQLLKLKVSPRAALHRRLITMAIAQATQNYKVLYDCSVSLTAAMTGTTNT